MMITTKDEILKKRFWLIQNIEFFLNECVYHRDHRDDYSDDKIVVWRFDTEEGKAKIV